MQIESTMNKLSTVGQCISICLYCYLTFSKRSWRMNKEAFMATERIVF